MNHGGATASAATAAADGLSQLLLNQATIAFYFLSLNFTVDIRHSL